jgi:hypothetical protein
VRPGVEEADDDALERDAENAQAGVAAATAARNEPVAW